jgi:ADP-ribosylglycohydrolase
MEAMRNAVTLGGDTDTVAALAGGILGARDGEQEPPYAHKVLLPPEATLTRLATGLATRSRIPPP